MSEQRHNANLVRERLDAAEACARLLRDHLTGNGGFGGKPTCLDCAGCRDAVQAWEQFNPRSPVFDQRQDADYVAPPLTVGSLFSGIGGFDLGLEAAGLRVIWQSEIEPYCNRVLAARWPHVPNLGDICLIDWSSVERPAVLCGGFPCQDISRAGRRAGIGGVKSGLWAEVYRAVRHLRPDYLLLENSTSLTVQGLEVVASDLAEIGYDAEWDCLPAQAFGASHIRDRIYVLAYPRGGRHRASDQTVFAGWASSQLHGRWAAQPGMGRVADGVPRRVDRVRSLGNAVCPPVAQWLGERILVAALIDGPGGAGRLEP